MGELHQKPTREQLKANAQAALDKLENDPPVDPAPDDPTPPADPPADPNPPADPPVDPNPPADPPSDPPVDPAPEDPKPGDTDYEQRYKDSSREAHRLAQKDKEVRKAVDDAAELGEPTDEEMQTAYPGWDSLDATQQQIAKDNLLNKKRFDLIHAATNKTRALDQWEEHVKEWATDPKTRNKYQELEGKTDDFVAYASVKERINNDFATLVSAFLSDREKNKVAHKGQNFPTSGGGNAAPVKVDDGKISASEGRVLMKTDYKKFKEMLKDGKIRNE